MNSEQQYIDLIEQHSDAIASHSPAVMNALRQQAFADFRRLGFPGRKEERYKYTDVQKAFAPDYGLNINRLKIPVNPYDVFTCDVPNLSTSLYFVVNDAFYDEALPAVSLPQGVMVCSMREAVERCPEVVAAHYGRLAPTGGDAVTALNTALAQDGLFIYVPKNVVVDRAIQVVNILRSDVDFMVNRRVLIVLEEGAQARILFCDHAVDDRRFLATQVAEAYVGENAHLELYDLEETHVKNTRFSHLYARQEAYSTATFAGFTLHNGYTRNQTDVVLAGRGAETNLYGCAIADQEQHVDNNTLIDHQAPDSHSTELYKYVLDDQSTGAFAGRVLVRAGAQGVTSQESNANLCATKEARMYTQPMLEIYADDVKCSHGSTVGQLDEQALFYMRQRGISEAEARTLLKFAFVTQVLDVLKLDALRDRLHYLVEKRFRGELGRCEGCKFRK
ncbi:MAG: Fe-S cluster assembly protein SufD [Clostridium sp.]|nr:Fe-S cluster assembly protein SufD [Clostridium sp.]